MSKGRVASHSSDGAAKSACTGRSSTRVVDFSDHKRGQNRSKDREIVARMVNRAKKLEW